MRVSGFRKFGCLLHVREEAYDSRSSLRSDTIKTMYLVCVLVPDTELLNPLGSVGNRNLFCSKEATLGRSLGRVRMEVVTMVRGLEHLAPSHPQPRSRGEGPEIE